MDIEKLARKLAPLMPDQVRRWLHARRLASPELRDLIDKQIVSAATRHLGYPNRVPLLSLPPERVAKGEFQLGTVLYDQSKWPMGLDRAELLQGLSIFGRSGSGKTNLVFHLLRQLVGKGIAVLFLDWKQTARHLIPDLGKPVRVYTPGKSLSPLQFDLFEVPPGIEPSVYKNHLLDVIADAYQLGEGARSLVQQALFTESSDQTSPTIADLISRIEQRPAQQRELGWKATALRALRSILYSGLVGSEGETADFFRGCTIIELDSLNHSARKLLVPLLCFWLYQAALVSGIREKLRLLIVLEEAHHYLYGEQQRARETLLEMLLRQCREVGIGFLTIDQHPHLMSSAALGNTYASVCLNLKDPRDVSKAAAISGVSAEEKGLFAQLPVGQGVLRLQGRYTEPAILRIPHVDVAKGSVSDELLRQFLAKTGARTVPIRGFVRDCGGVRRFPSVDDRLDEGGFALLEDVLRNPDDGVKERYRRLGVGGSTGHALKERLVERGWLEAEVVPVGTSRKVLLRVSRGAHELLGIQDLNANRESLAHAYWKRFYAKQLEQLGYVVKVESPRNGGFADLIGAKDQNRVAVEIETGKSDVVSNVKAGLAARFDQVLVVAITSRVLADTEVELARAGLLVRHRIQLLRAGESAALVLGGNN